MITTSITNSFKKELLEGVHTSSDTYKIALYTSAANLDKTTTAWTATGEVGAGGGYTAGGQDLVGLVVDIDGDIAYMDWTTNPVWPSATITARGCMIYNGSKSNKCVAVFDFGSDVSSTSGDFTVNLPSPGATAIIRAS